MEKQAFYEELPHTVRCECCRKEIPKVEWGIGRFGQAEWMGVGIAKCAKCNWLKICAAGSDELAHKEAQYMRLKLIVHLGL